MRKKHRRRQQTIKSLIPLGEASYKDHMMPSSSIKEQIQGNFIHREIPLHNFLLWPWLSHL